MKFIYLLLLLLLLCSLSCYTTAQESAASIKQQMSAIRKSTNWEDPVAAKKANEQIKELSKQLMMTGNPLGSQPPNLSKTEAEQAKKDAVDEQMKVWGQVMKSASGGETADILLAEPVREEIKEDYRDDEAEGLNPAMLGECTTLILDFSVPFTQTLVSNMEMFTSIKNLVIIGVESNVPVDLNNILNKAKKYPLYELYIVGFEANLKKIPENIMLFPRLSILGLYGNQISVLPANLIKLNNLKVLQLDYNPILTLGPLNELLKNLKELSIRKTKISESEVADLKKMFPNCKIQAE
jgi:hypothetical protein